MCSVVSNSVTFLAVNGNVWSAALRKQWLPFSCKKNRNCWHTVGIRNRVVLSSGVVNFHLSLTSRLSHCLQHTQQYVRLLSCARKRHSTRSTAVAWFPLTVNLISYYQNPQWLQKLQMTNGILAFIHHYISNCIWPSLIFISMSSRIIRQGCISTTFPERK